MGADACLTSLDMCVHHRYPTWNEVLLPNNLTTGVILGQVSSMLLSFSVLVASKKSTCLRHTFTAARWKYPQPTNSKAWRDICRQLRWTIWTWCKLSAIFSRFMYHCINNIVLTIKQSCVRWHNRNLIWILPPVTWLSWPFHKKILVAWIQECSRFKECLTPHLSRENAYCLVDINKNTQGSLTAYRTLTGFVLREGRCRVSDETP